MTEAYRLQRLVWVLLNGVALVMQILLAAPLAHGAQSARLPFTDRDYVYPAATRGDSAARRAAILAGSDGDLVPYAAIDGKSYVLRQLSGRYVAVLIDDRDLATYTEAAARDLVDRLDVLYAHFTEIMGGEPGGPSLLTVAFVKTCGGGCGYIGTKGIELDPGMFDPAGPYPDDAPYLYAIHELTHNFDLYSSYAMYGSDVGHSWTDFMNIYISFFDRAGVSGRTPEATVQNGIDLFFRPYVEFSERSWERCVRDDACDPDGDMGQHALGGMALRLAQVHGPAAVKNAMHFLRGAISSRALNAQSMTILQKNDLLVESLGRGANADVSCFLDAIDWPLSSALRTQLHQLGANSLCRDEDGDGWSGYDGDCNDRDSSTNPGTPESSDGRDEDCSGVIDDVELVELPGDSPSRAEPRLVPVPSTTMGNLLGPNDTDEYRFTLGIRSPVVITLRSLGEFQGWAFLYPMGSDARRGYTYTGAGSQSTLTTTLDRGTWRVVVAYNTQSHAGDYGLQLTAPESWPPEFRAPPAGTGASGSVSLVAPAPPRFVATASPRVRFWVSGIGWVGSTSVSGNVATLLWTPPPGRDLATIHYRIQYMDSDVPASLASAPRSLAVRDVAPSLTAAPSGNGRGRVQSADGSIDCGPRCSATYASGATVELRASADPGSMFAGWSGANCTGRGACRVVASDASTVSASFIKLGSPSCNPTANALCAQNKRFRIEATWRDFAGKGGAGQIANGKTADSGLVYFYGPNNWEILAKVLDACSSPGNGNFWVFGAAATTLEYSLAVTDTASGDVKIYVNPLGKPSGAITDTLAFPACPGGGSTSVLDTERGVLRTEVAESERPRAVLGRGQLVESVAATNGCVASNTVACLQGGRFKVEVAWKDFAGQGGPGLVASNHTSDSGLIYFYGPDNWEILLKVLDGCGTDGNDHYWVFAAAATTLEYKLTVTDTVAGQVRTYQNELGTASPAITDTEAFATCP